MKTRTSINHLSGMEQNALRSIKKKIVERLSPLLIFCFNSSATQSVNRNCFSSDDRTEDWYFSCDLLIVVPDDLAIDSDTKKEVEESVEHFGKVRAFIHPLDFVVQQIKEENLFFAWVQCIGIVLYDKNNSLSLLPAPISNYKEYKAQAEQFYSEDLQFEKYLEKKIIPVSQPVNGNDKQATIGKEIMDVAIKRIPVGLENRVNEVPGQLFPQNLSQEEIANPHLVIHSFFDEFGLQGAKKYISGWMAAVYEKENPVKRSPSNLIYFTERLFRLIEAGWLINQMDNSKRLANLSLQYDLEKIDFMDPVLYCNRLYKEMSWDIFPRSLSAKEYISPYRVFSKIFKFHSLSKWKDELRNILHLALSNCDIEHTGETINFLGYKKHLDKLVEASHLIDVREFEWSNNQLFLKVYNETATE